MRNSLLVLLSVLGCVLLAACSCTSSEDPFEDISTAKKEKPKAVKKSSSLLDEFDFAKKNSKEEERKRKMRDVTRRLDDESSAVFPWRDGGSKRSEELHDSIRNESKQSSYFDW